MALGERTCETWKPLATSFVQQHNIDSIATHPYLSSIHIISIIAMRTYRKYSKQKCVWFSQVSDYIHSYTHYISHMRFKSIFSLRCVINEQTVKNIVPLGLWILFRTRYSIVLSESHLTAQAFCLMRWERNANQLLVAVDTTMNWFDTLL